MIFHKYRENSPYEFFFLSSLCKVKKETKKYYHNDEFLRSVGKKLGQFD